VDDGSVDATPGILGAHARADSRFRVLRQEPAGMVAASERARAEARAPLLARMDADDVALPERLELQVAAIEEEGLAVVGGRVEYFPDPTAGMRGYADWLNSLVTVEAAQRKLGKRIHGAPVVPVERAADFPAALALGAVSGPEGRAQVRELAAGLGLVEGRDFVAIA